MYFIWTLDKVIKEARVIQSKNIDISISFLPVETKTKEDVLKNTKTYIEILERIKAEGIKGEATLKLHQFGVYKYKDLMQEQVDKVVAHADKLGLFIWVDMERMETVDATIELFNDLIKRYTNVGICLQTCLRRTEKDMHTLLVNRVPTRLVKGGFYYPYDITDWSEVTDNFSKLMEYMLEHSDRPCIATHDTALIEKGKQIIKEKNIQNAEFHFFYGVKNEIAEELVSEGFKASIYIPYGNLFSYIWHGFRTFDNLRNIQRVLRFKKIK